MSHISDSDHRKLEVIILPDCVVESHQVSDASRGLRRVHTTKVWRTERVLGYGGFSEVLLQALDNDTEKKRALKVIRGMRMTQAECQRELTAMIEFTKPKYQAAAVFVEFLGWFQNPSDNSTYLAMEYMRGGDLEECLLDLESSIKTRPAIPEDDIKEITSQILEGLKIMHSEGFAHRDLKPKNIFVVQRKPEWWVKLGDFGLSKKQTDGTALRTQAGTERYMGPELYFYVPGLLMETSEYTNAVDIWALGCVVYRIMTRAVPFPGLLSLRNYSVGKEELCFELPSSMAEAEIFVRDLLAPHPAKRPTASAALEHSWVIAKRKYNLNQSCTTSSSISQTNAENQSGYNTASHLGLQSYLSLPETSNVFKSSLGQAAPSKPIPESKQIINSTSSSLDSKLVSASSNQTVRLQDAVTSAAQHTLKGHFGWISAVAFSPDGKLVASASHDYTVRLWNAATGAAHRTLKGHSSWVSAVVFSPDGKLVVSASSDKTVRLWDAATGAAQRTLNAHSDRVSAVVFSPDGKLIASASNDKTVRLWDAATNAAQNILKGHSGWVSAVAFSPDSKLVATASNDYTVRLWNAATGAARRRLEGHSDRVSAVAFSPDGKFVASASHDYTVRLWNAATGAAQRGLEGHSDRVSAVAFSPDGKLVASASHDYTVRLWDAATNAAQNILKGHSGWVSAVAFSPDSKLVASASNDYTVRLWNAATGAAQRRLEGHSDVVSAVAFSPDGKLVASASGDQTVRLWEVAICTAHNSPLTYS